MTTLGDVMVTRGGSLNPGSFPSEEFELYSIPAHDRGGSEFTLGSEIGSSKQVVQPGDVMVSKIIPHIRRARVVGPQRGRRQIASGEWIVFRGQNFDSGYLRHFLVSDGFHRQFMNTVAGVGGSLVRARPAQVKSIPLPLPPLPEQRRIAAILDHADALRAKRRQVLTHLNSLTQSLFNDMFGDLSERVPLGEALSDCPIFTDGDWVESKDQDPNGDVRLTQLADVGDGHWIDKSSRFLTSAKAEKLRCTHLQAGDVLVARMPDPLGRACIFPGSDRPSVTVVDVCIIRPNTGKHTPTWLMAAINSPAARSQIARLATGTTRSRVSRGNLAKVTIPVAPIGAQERFTERIQKMRAQENAARSALSVNETLFASLQSRAFRGEL